MIVILRYVLRSRGGHYMMVDNDMMITGASGDIQESLWSLNAV